MVSITSDIDWAPDYVIEHMIQLFEEFDNKCTFFATHKSGTLNRIDKKSFEIAIHPNFNNLIFNNQIISAEKIVKDLLELYPNAIGLRSHSVTHSSRLQQLFYNLGIKYDSNQFVPYNYDTKPYMCWSGVLRIPYNWEDDVHYMYGNHFDNIFLRKINIEMKNIIMDFHPIHVYLNTYNREHYNTARKYINNYKLLKKYINKKHKGIKDYLVEVLSYMREKKVKSKLLKDINNEYRNNR